MSTQCFIPLDGGGICRVASFEEEQISKDHLQFEHGECLDLQECSFSYQVKSKRDPEKCTEKEQLATRVR